MALQPQPHPPMVARQPGNGMKRGAHIPWFNPREMDDATVLQLSTGREALLSQLFNALRERMEHPGSFHHWLLTGTRGAGKSFFLRLVQSSFAEAVGLQARFVLLPEEHRNIFSAHEFLGEIERMLQVDQGAIGAAPAWRVDNPEQAWNSALASLLKAFAEPLLVVGVENFDELLAQAFSDEIDNARLRHLMSNEPRIMLVATAVQGSFDENYEQRLFRQFEHHPIPPWDTADHREYLTRRAQRSGQEPTRLQLARIDAYSRYTGGNARAAAVLAGAILDEHDPLDAAEDLDAAIEKMSDYYRALIDRIPPKTRKLFDALIRGGEPASQTEIAERTGARQNEISRAFLWLVDQGYVGESRLPGAKAKQYRVLDRLFVQFYRMRSISPGQRSKLALMADLLADILVFQDKWRFAHRYANDGHALEARTLVELALKERLVDIALLPESVCATDKLCALGTGWAEWDAILEMPTNQRYEEILKRYPSDQELKRVLEEVTPLARAANRGKVWGSQLVPLLEESLSLCPVEKFLALIFMLSPTSSEFQWAELTKIFQEEVPEFEKLGQQFPADMDKFKKRFELAHLFPRTDSLNNFSIGILSGRDIHRGLTIEDAALWSAQAVICWMNANYPEPAEASLRTCLKALGKLRDDVDASPDSVLKICELLEPKLAGLPAMQRANTHEIVGISLEETGRYSEAYRIHAQAREERLEDGKPAVSTWNLEKMAWSQSRLGNLDQSIAEHRQAFEERLAQDRLESAAWNLGQIARHAAVQSDAEAAWARLDQEIDKVKDTPVKAIQQLGDAVADTARRQGEPAAFALSHALLQGLAQRPQYPLEAALRALWIDMVEMAVPHPVLRDLLDEWPQLFDYGASPSLPTLNQLLREWLDDLDTPTEQRDARRMTLDPDLATTLEALAQGLPRSAQRRLQLSKPSYPGQVDSEKPAG